MKKLLKWMTLASISACVGFMFAVTFTQYIIPFCVKNIPNRNEFLDINLHITSNVLTEKDVEEYYFRLENTHNNISIEDININMNFQSVIDKEVLHYAIGVLGLQMQIGEGNKNSNCVNITIEKIFPKGVLLIDYFIRKKRFGKPPFHVQNLGNNFCSIEYSYNYLGATICQQIKIPIPEIELKE